LAADCFATFHEDSKNDLSRGYGNLVYVDGHVEQIYVDQQLRQKMHGVSESISYSSRSRRAFSWHPAGNLYYAWASKSPPPGGWDDQ
jgi:prepilin-type processing-associated H-X9-DG protein